MCLTWMKTILLESQLQKTVGTEPVMFHHIINFYLAVGLLTQSKTSALANKTASGLEKKIRHKKSQVSTIILSGCEFVVRDTSTATDFNFDRLAEYLDPTENSIAYNLTTTILNNSTYYYKIKLFPAM